MSPWEAQSTWCTTLEDDHFLYFSFLIQDARKYPLKHFRNVPTHEAQVVNFAEIPEVSKPFRRPAYAGPFCRIAAVSIVVQHIESVSLSVHVDRVRGCKREARVVMIGPKGETVPIQRFISSLLTGM